jgi:hypothetical protein
MNTQEEMDKYKSDLTKSVENQNGISKYLKSRRESIFPKKRSSVATAVSRINISCID